VCKSLGETKGSKQREVRQSGEQFMGSLLSGFSAEESQQLVYWNYFGVWGVMP
jgi:hypothetical protein